MKNVLLINAHQPYPFSEGRLNQAFVERATAHLRGKGYEVRTTTMTEEWETEDEIEKHQWADVVLLQTPVNWMGVPWSFKRYMDFVYSAGMDGRLCEGDGRTRKDPSRQYGSGGALSGKHYMLSLTFKFFGMTPLETFASHDVMKNPDIENDFARFEAHLDRNFPAVAARA